MTFKLRVYCELSQIYEIQRAIVPCLWGGYYLMRPGEDTAGLKRYLSIFSDLIFDSSVGPGIPSLAAAPDRPDTRPPLSRRAASIISFSWVASLRDRSIWLFVSVPSGDRESQLSSTENSSVSQTITDRSMTFCSSRILPAQLYAWSRSSVFLFTARKLFPAFLA